MLRPRINLEALNWQPDESVSTYCKIRFHERHVRVAMPAPLPFRNIPTRSITIVKQHLMPRTLLRYLALVDEDHSDVIWIWLSYNVKIVSHTPGRLTAQHTRLTTRQQWWEQNYTPAPTGTFLFPCFGCILLYFLKFHLFYNVYVGTPS
jgi:hypothetical protein